MIKPLIRSSEMDRVLSCNGSLTITRMVDPRDGDEGHEGTMIHWMIADHLIREHGAIPPDGGLPPPSVPAGYKLPAFSAWMVDWAVRHVLETVPPDWSLLVEVEMEHEFGRWINRGHADIVAISPDATESIGIDWKTGRDPVDPAESNWQILSYEVLKKLSWPSLRKCTFQIAQPRLNEEDGYERVSTVVLEGDRLENAPAGLDREVNKALDNQDEINTGLKQCKYCVGCSCPAIRQLMKMRLTPEVLDTIKRKPDDATLGDFVIDARILKKPIEDAEAILHERLDASETVHAGCGTVITRKIQRGSYEIADPVKFFQAAKVLLPKEEAIARAFSPSMTALRDEIAAQMNVPKTSKNGISAEGIFDAQLRPLVKQNDRRILVFT